MRQGKGGTVLASVDDCVDASTQGLEGYVKEPKSLITVASNRKLENRNWKITNDK